VLVTDDGTQPSAQGLIDSAYPRVQWVQGPQRGPAANRNNGTRHAQGEWLVFTDDDCLPEPGWLAAFADVLKTNPEAQVLEGRTYVDRPRQSLAEVAPVNETGGYLWSCNFAVARHVFEQLGGFDERFPDAAMEDVDFRVRLIKAGYDFPFVPTAGVCHPWRIGSAAKEYKRNRRSTEIFLQLHPEAKKEINLRYFLRVTARQCLKETLPGIFRFQGRGLDQALQRHWGGLLMAGFSLRRQLF
jgi:GT2 family glycosyltransferase